MTDGPILLTTGSFGAVYLDRRLKDAWLEIDARHRRHLTRYMKCYSEQGPKTLNKQQFRSEGRHSGGRKDGHEYHISAFKSGQNRLYGSHISFKLDSDETVTGFVISSGFVVASIDDQKKQQKADQNLLKSAAKRLAVLDEGKVKP